MIIYLKKKVRKFGYWLVMLTTPRDKGRFRELDCLKKGDK